MHKKWACQHCQRRQRQTLSPFQPTSRFSSLTGAVELLVAGLVFLFPVRAQLFSAVEPSGVWSSGCANTSAPPSLICSQDGTLWTCRCTADLCNQIASVTDQLSKLRNNESESVVSLGEALGHSESATYSAAASPSFCRVCRSAASNAGTSALQDERSACLVLRSTCAKENSA